MKQLPLEVVKAPNWMVSFSYIKQKDTPRIRKKSGDPLSQATPTKKRRAVIGVRVGGNARLGLGSPVD